MGQYGEVAMAEVRAIIPERPVQRALLGTQIADSLRARRERWDTSYIVFQGDTMDAMAPVVAALRDT